MVSWIQGYYGLEPRVSAERAQDVLNLEHNVRVPGGALVRTSFFLSGETDSSLSRPWLCQHLASASEIVLWLI